MRTLFKESISFFFAIGIIFVICIFIISLSQFKKLIKAGDWVDHTYQVVISAQEILEDITYIEAMQNGYLLFNDPDYKSEYEKTAKSVNASLISLFYHISDNPSQRNRAAEIKSLVEKRLQLIEEINSVKAQNKANSSELINLLNENKILSTQIRGAVNHFIQEENQLLQQRNNTVKQETRFNSGLLILIQTISTVFLIFAFISIYRNRKEINSKEKQLRGIIDGAKDIIVVVDPKMRLLIFNDAFKAEFLKLFHKEVKVGMTFEEALSNAPQFNDFVVNIWKESLEATEPYSKHVDIEVEGNIFSYEINSSKLYDDHQLLGAVQITRNITERMKEQQELRKANVQLQQTMEELKDKNEKITILLEMSDLVLAASSLEELSTITSKFAKQILDFSNGYTYFMHPSRNMLEANSSWGNPISLTKQFTPDDCWALRLGRIHHYTKQNDLVCAHAKENVFYMCVPLRAQNDIFGLLYIEFDGDQSEGNLANNDKLMVGAFAEVTALALANVTLRENLKFQSTRDPLTGLYNRRYLEEFLSKLIAQSERNHQPISILMLDLDHFKRVNDVHGHEAGDMALKEFSKVLLNEIRPGDIAARFGGEEFIIVLYNTEIKTAYMRANSIRSQISSLLLKYGADFLGKVTVSIGISSYPKDGLNTKSLIESADKALYMAKNTGRNKVVDSESLQSTLLQEDPVAQNGNHKSS